MVKTKVVSFVSAMLLFFGATSGAFALTESSTCNTVATESMPASSAAGQASQTQNEIENGDMELLEDVQAVSPVYEPPRPGQKRYKVHVLVVTNRQQEDIKPNVHSVSKLSRLANRVKFLNTASSLGLTYCDCLVSFAGKPDMDLLESPMDCKVSPYGWVKWHLKSPKIESIHIIGEQEAIAWLKKASLDGQVYVNIPGSFTRFDEAAKRGAAPVIAFNTTAAFTFSWPSLGSINPTSYGYDGVQAERSIKAFEELMNKLADEFGSENVHVIVHSMGNRIVCWTSAVRMLKASCTQGAVKKFGRLEMVSADVDQSLFIDNYAEPIGNTFEAVDIWASKKDKALALSKLVHKKPRLGQKVKEFPVIPNMRFVVFTKADRGMFGHTVPFPILSRVIKSKGTCPGKPWKFVRLRDGVSPVDQVVKREKDE